LFLWFEIYIFIGCVGLSHVALHKYYLYKKIYKYHHSINYITMTYPDTYLEIILQGLGMFHYGGLQ